ncbi:MAG: hypothetical protein RSA01_07300 [Clostridium sp.]
MNRYFNSFFSIFLNLFRVALTFQGIYILFQGNYFEGLYCFLTLGITFLLNKIYKVAKINPNKLLRFFVVLFIFLSMYLGHTNHMYSIVTNWDDILHLSSGFIITLFGFLIVEKIDRNNSILYNKTFICFYLIIFSIATAGVWEIYEFTTDFLFNLQSQGGSLTDTMIDIINGTVGGIVISIIYNFKPQLFKSTNN